MQLNLFRIAYPVTSLGPGKRVVIWVAGCRKRCPGCISPEIQDPSAGKLIDTAVLANHLLNLSHDLAGITISGGEPFDQGEALAELLGVLKQMRPGWSVIVYTGYCLNTVRKKDECRSLLDVVDIVIDGPFKQAIPSQHPLAGSGNQSVNFLSDDSKGMQTAVDESINNAISYGCSGDEINMIIGVMDIKHRLKIHEEMHLAKRTKTISTRI